MSSTRASIFVLLAILAFAAGLAFFLHHVPFDLPSFAAWGGILAALFGALCALRPPRWLGIRRRTAGAAIVLAGVAVAAVAIVWPAPVVTVSSPSQRLDDFLSTYQFAEYHEGRVQAPLERVTEAVRQVSMADMPAAVFLMRLRALAGGRTEATPPDPRPILELMAKPGTGFLPLDTADPTEVVFGMAGRPWTNEPPPPVRTPEDFLAFAQPGHVRVAFNIRVRDEGDGWCLVSTETRILGNDHEARRVFARYWRLIYPGSAIIRRVWLDTIIARAGRPAGAPPAGDAASAAATAILESVVEEGPVPVPGVAVSVFRNGQEIYSSAAGRADVEDGVDARPDTRFRIYSTSKTLTSAAAFALADEGILDLDAPIGRHLPELPADKHPITTRQLLAHRGGIRHYRDGEWLSVSSRRCADPLEALSDFIDDPLVHPPGTTTEYTSFGYVLVSAVLQAAAGEPYAEVMGRTVFGPAGMRSIALEGVPVEGHPVADFYDHEEDGAEQPFVRTSEDGVDASCKFGGGGFVATARDLAAFGQGLIDGRLLTAAALADMTTVVTPAAEDGSHPPQGHGIFVEDPFPGFPDVPPDQTARAIWHGGSARGGYSVLIAYPDEGVSVGIVSNVNAGGWLIFRAHDIARGWWRAP